MLEDWGDVLCLFCCLCFVGVLLSVFGSDFECSSACLVTVSGLLFVVFIWEYSLSLHSFDCLILELRLLAKLTTGNEESPR